MSLFDGTDETDPAGAPQPNLAGPTNIVQPGIPDGGLPQPKAGWQGGVAGLFDRAEEAARGVGHNLMPVPTALKGMLSDDDISNARRQGLLNFGIAMSQGHGENALASLGRGLQAAQGAFSDHLNGVMEQKKQAEVEQQRQQLIAQQQQILGARVKIAQQFPAGMNETADQTVTRFGKMAAASATAGDTESATKYAALAKDLRAPAPPAPHQINAGDKTIMVDPTGKVIREDKINETPGQVQRDTLAAKRADIADQRFQQTADRQDATEQRATRNQQNVIVHDFDNTAKDYHAAEAGYGVLQAAKANPKNFMTPMTALDALARMLNPKGAVRIGTINVLKAQGSFGDRLERNIDMLKSGKWPDGMQKQIFDMADSIMQEHATDFDAAREEAVQRGIAQGVDVSKLLHNRRQIGGGANKKTSTGKLGTY